MARTSSQGDIANAESLRASVNRLLVSLAIEGSPTNDYSNGSGDREAVCFACGSTRVALRRGLRDYHTVLKRQYALSVCADCGSARLADELTFHEQVALYPPTFYSYVSAVKRHPLLAALDKFRYDRHRFRPSFKRLLEVGSGCGDFLVTLKDRGAVLGLERSHDARRAALELGVDVRVGDVGDAGLFEPESFDFVYLSHSFEHLDDPAAALHSIKTWLEPDGKIFLAVPNFAGTIPRLFPKQWYNLALPLHVSQFTPHGIEALLERNGFTVDAIRFNSDPFSIPMTILFVCAGDATSLKGFVKAAVFACSLALVPLSRLLDIARRGDCMEVYAHRTRAGDAARANPRS